MNWKPAERIAGAVLYEGYLLYPYRQSALKNRRRFTFGVVNPGESSETGTECLLEGGPGTRLAVKLRFLQEQGSSIEEREVLVEDIRLDGILVTAGRRSFSFPPLSGMLEFRAEAAEAGLIKIVIRVLNQSPGGEAAASLLSCHILLGVGDGAFLSMIDPPAIGRDSAAACRIRGLWPVLAGTSPDRSLLLAAPIILSDYPEVAPESPFDFFDGTEIDEMLTLRILTLSDREKEEVRRGDGRARRLLERTEALSTDQRLALHAGMRRSGASPAGLKAGDRVRLRPKGRADILDLALNGREATVESVEEDLEGRFYVAVTVDDDPGSDLGRLGQPGHRFFYRPEEVEPL